MLALTFHLRRKNMEKIGLINKLVVFATNEWESLQAIEATHAFSLHTENL